MPQRKKSHVREAIIGAARERFAEQGIEGSPLAAIAADAGTSVGNLYKYFADKDQLFRAAVGPEIGKEIRGLLRRQVEALGTVRDVGTLPPEHPYWEAAAQTRAFSIEHRHELLFLLRHAEGFADEVAADLTRLSSEYAAHAYPGLELGAADRRALRRIYRAYVASIADILAEERSPRADRKSVV